MIERITVHNFQSIRDADIDLGKITIIVGDSNSGKSAFMRAVTALTSGVRGSSVITHGEKEAQVSAFLPGWEVRLTRKKTTTEYKIIDLVTGEGKSLPKGNGKVPERVLELLQPGVAHYADQHDKPFLLDASGAEVARQLGKLTNVDTVFEAARKGLRDRQALAGVLKLREADLADAEIYLKSFQDLSRRSEELSNIEKLLEEAEEDQKILDDLELAISDLERSLKALSDIRVYPDVPDISDIVDLYDSYVLVDTLIKSCENGLQEIAELNKVIKAADEEHKSLDEDLHSLLVEAGVCPTCNQPIRE